MEKVVSGAGWVWDRLFLVKCAQRRRALLIIVAQEAEVTRGKKVTPPPRGVTSSRGVSSPEGEGTPLALVLPATTDAHVLYLVTRNGPTPGAVMRKPVRHEK